MATLTIGISGSGIVNGSTDYTLTDPMVTRLIEAMRYYYGAGSNAQVLAAWADGLVEHTKSKVMAAERNTAVVPPVEIS